MFVLCGIKCDGIWYTSSLRDRIELILNSPVPGKNHRTTLVDMMQADYMQLCQDFTAVDIRKNYQYSFDMHCNIYTRI
jgi:hypothetical protein